MSHNKILTELRRNKSISREGRIDRRQLLQTAAAGAIVAGAGVGAVLWPQSADAQVGPIYDLGIDNSLGGLRTYNGKTPGPTMRVDPGESLRVDITNRLPGETGLNNICPNPSEHNGFHGSNVTNFHTHGLHVSPYKSQSGRDSDNVFLSLYPVTQIMPTDCNAPDRNNKENWRFGKNQFEFDLPSSHPSGTFWYHAHKHGSTAQQVGNGMAGPLIVNDTLNSMPSYIRAASQSRRDHIFMLQIQGVDPANTNPSGNVAIVKADPAGGGDVNPTLKVKRGQVHRLRFINAATRADSFISINPTGGAYELYQIAFDGLTLAQRHTVAEGGTANPWENPTAMAPGNRTDFLLRIPPNAPEGRFLLAANQPAASVLMNVAALQEEPIQLAIEIEGDQSPPDPWTDDPWLPGPGLLPITPDGAVRREVRFNTNAEGGLAIDGEKYTGKIKEPTMKLGTVGNWTVFNDTGGTHPFHIHVNPFFITHIDGQSLAELDDDNPQKQLMRWQDTIGLPPKPSGGAPGSVQFLTRFETFTGAFVIHCHILGHEDGGMMQKIAVTA